jgi:Protein of unknown function (DUF4238)
MTQHKKQHYVPQFYLRHLSEDGVGLCRYSLADETLERSNIENTFQSFYFHGKGTVGLELEKAMSQLEAKHAPIIQEILDTRSVALISPKDGQDYSQKRFLLDVFILLTSTRTKLAKKQTEAAANAVLDIRKPIWAQSKEAKAEGITLDALSRVKIRRDTAGLEGMVSAMIGPPSAISDLAVRLLINETDSPFITSDSPSVFYNFLRWGDMIMSGWQAPGLMIFLSLSDDAMLWLFDPLMYEPQSNITSVSTLFLKRDKDVDELNRLQILNADEHLIFSNLDDREYVSKLYKPLRARRRSALIVTEKVTEFDVGEERHEIHRTGRTEIDYRPHLSFFRVRKTYAEDRKRAYEEHVVKFGPKRLFVRDQALFAFHITEVRKFWKEKRMNTLQSS